MIRRERCIVFDIDGTICPVKLSDQSYDDVVPHPEMLERLKEYREQGFYIILSTSRNMNTYNGNVGLLIAKTAKHLLGWLDLHDVPYDELHVGKPWPGKGGFYVDDKSIRPDEFLKLDYGEILALVGEDVAKARGLMTTVIITMAGFGRRFLDAGYKIPKYRIEAHRRTLFAWSMLSLKSFIESGATFVFVARAADDAADFIQSEASDLGILSTRIVEIDAPTDGQATTALLASSAVTAPSQPMLIYNIDTFVHPSALPAGSVRGDGWIPCFPGAGDHWSFVKADEWGRANEVREKVRISDRATVGLYWFSSFDLFAEAYAAYYAHPGGVESGERYVAPLYNYLLATDAPVFVHDVPTSAVFPLGVPAEVEWFRSQEPPILG